MKRKNKKGFTLIELLAIIVILAIIAVITVPLILNIINDAQKNASIDSAYGYKSALEKYYMKKVVENTENELPNGYKNVSELPEDFIVSGESPSDGWVKLNKGIVEDYSLKYDEYVVTKYKDKDVKSSKRATIASTIPVPDEYKEVEYLESKGTQYINTGVIPNNTTGYEITLSIPNPATDAFRFGARQNTGDTRFTLGAIRNEVYFGFGKNYALDSHKFPIVANQPFTAKFNYLNSRLCTTNTSSEEVTFENINFEFTQNIVLFGSNTGGTINKIAQKLYNNKITQNDKVIRDFVPVIRKSDNKPGMLDLVSRTNNLIPNMSNWENGYISTAGTISAMSNTKQEKVSPFIEIDSISNITFSIDNGSFPSIGTESEQRGWRSIGFYDETKTFISRLGGIGENALAIAVPANAKYIRISMRTFGESKNVMLNEGTTALPYEPYGYKFYTNNGTGEFIAGPEI